MKKILLLLLLCVLIPAFAQATTVSGTIVDAGAQAWFGGTVTLTFNVSPLNPGGPYFQNGVPFNTNQVVVGTLDGSGHYSITVPDNLTITPSGTSWNFQFAPLATAQVFVAKGVVVTGGTFTFSPTPPAIAVDLLNPPGPTARAYADAEITGAAIGSQYYNLTSQLIRVCQVSAGNLCTLWANVGGGGGGGGAPSVGPLGAIQESNGAGLFQAGVGIDDGTNLTVNRNVAFLGPNPVIDLTRLGVRTGNFATTGGISSGLNALTVVDGSQYINGDGIVVRGAGANCTLTTPAAPVVTASNASSELGTGLVVNNSSGGTGYQYQVVALSIGGCYTPASPVTAIANGQATLGTTSANVAGWTRSGNVVTVTTSAPHTIVQGSFVYISTFAIDGSYRVASVPDNTHFTVAEGTSTLNGAAASGAGTGTVSWWVGNHVKWTTVAGAVKYLIYGRVSGSMTLLAVSLPDSNNFSGSQLTSDPLYLTWDDWGTTISKVPTVPDYYPSTPPVSAKANDLITTIASGGGTNNIVTSDAAGNTVVGALVGNDNTKPFLNALTATYGSGAQKGVLRFPVTTGPSDFYLFRSMVLMALFPSTIAIQQDGPVAFGDTAIMARVQWKGQDNPLTGGQFSFNRTPSINSGSAHPIIYAISGTIVDFTNVEIGGFSDSQNLLVIDAATIPADTLRNVTFNNQSTDLYGQNIIIRNNINGGGNWEFDNVSLSGGSLNTNIGNPVPLFQVTQGLGPSTLKRIMMTQRGLFLGANTNGTQTTIDNLYCQACFTPHVLLDNSTGFPVTSSLSITNSILDTTSSPLVAYLGQQNGVIKIFGSNGIGGAATQVVNGSGSMALDVEGVGFAVNFLGQNVFVDNVPSNVSAIPGPPYSTISVPYPLRRSDMSIALGTPFSIYVKGLKQPAPTCSVSAGGTVSLGAKNISVAPVFANGGEGQISDQSTTCTTTGGNQTVTVNWTLATGAIGYDLYINGFSLQCAAPLVVGGSTLSYIWNSLVPCGQSQSSDAGSGPSGLSNGNIFSPQFSIVAADGGGKGTLSAPSLSSNPAWSMPDNSGVGIFAVNPTTPTGVPQVPVFIPGTTPPNSSASYQLQGIPINTQACASPYTVVPTDRGKVVAINSAGACAVTVPQPGTAGFTNNIAFIACNEGAGTSTWTSTSSTISTFTGSSFVVGPLALTNGQCTTFYTDGTNYLSVRHGGAGGGGSSTPQELVLSAEQSPYNLVNDAKNCTSSMTSGSAVWTIVSGCTLVSLDATNHKTVVVPGAGAAGATLVTTISTFTDSTHVTLAAAASTTVTSITSPYYGTDNCTAATALMTAAGSVSQNTVVWFPQGTDYIVSCAMTVPINTSVLMHGKLRVGSLAQTAVLQSTFTGAVPFWSHQFVEGGVIDLGDTGLAGIWARQFRHITVHRVNVRNLRSATSQKGYWVGDPNGGAGAGGYEFDIYDSSCGDHNDTGGATSYCLFIDPTANGPATDTTSVGLIANGVSIGISDGKGGSRHELAHVWGPSLTIAFQDIAGRTSWINDECDTPSSKGFDIQAIQSQIIGGRCFFGSAGTDNTATAISSSLTDPQIVVHGFLVQGIASHRWAADSNLLPSQLATSTITGVVGTSFVTTQNLSGQSIFPGAIQGGPLRSPEIAAPSGVAANDILYADSTAHRFKMNNNNGGAVTVTSLIAAGTSALGTGAITSGTCATVVTTSATGTATTDVISFGFNGDPTAVTGYTPATAGGVYIVAYPTANNVNFKVCNPTSSSITPGAITLNWQVNR